MYITRRSINSWLTALVMMSAGLRSPGHLGSSKSPARDFSWAQSCPTARCRARPMPDWRQMPIAAL
eukprot:15440605-Alexandrium_andersonii.AAC.1